MLPGTGQNSAGQAANKIMRIFFIVEESKLFDHEYQGDARFGGAEIVFGSAADLPAAFRTRIFVVIEVSVTHADRRLEAPAVAQHPVVAVADARADEPTLITMVSEITPWPDRPRQHRPQL